MFQGVEESWRWRVFWGPRKRRRGFVPEGTNLVLVEEGSIGCGEDRGGDLWGSKAEEI